MTRTDSAAELLISGRVNCAQAVLTSFCEELGLNRDIALKITKCFGGGIAGSGNTCGAVTGAYMVIGLKQRETLSETPGKEKVKMLTTKFADQFVRLHGSILCRDLLGYDVSQPEQLAIVVQKKLFAIKCPIFVRDSVSILEKI